MKRTVVIVVVIVLVPLALLLAGWVWVLTSPDPVAALPARWLPWPTVCSTRGCVTTWAWQRQLVANQLFSAAANEISPTSAEVLSQLTRQHLAHYAQVQSPVTLADAQRYREEVLNLRDEDLARKQTGLSLGDYDRYVVTPFLEQESVRQQQRAESVDDLYQQLSQQRFIIAWPLGLRWDQNQAKIVGTSWYASAQ